MQTTTMKPGLLVSLKTSITGNAQYARNDIEPEHITAEGTKLAKWETEKTIIDPEEHEKAVKVRTACVVAIRKYCSVTAFGLLCPEDKKAELDEAVKTAHALASEFNNSASITKISIYVIAGRIAADDVEAVRAINSEVRGLIEEMEQGLRRLDVSAVRAAANKAKSIGQMLSPNAAERIKVAVDAAREVARSIVKSGEEGVVVIDRLLIKRLAASRTAFLDVDGEVSEISEPAATSRAVDLEPVEPVNVPITKVPQPTLELE